MSTPAPPSDATSSAVLRTWKFFLSPSAIPVSISEASQRLTQNIRFFLPLYVALALIIFIHTLHHQLLSLTLFLCIFAAWIYLIFTREEPISILDYDVDQRIIVGFLSLITSVAVFWTNTWMKLLMALIVGSVIALTHGVLRVPENSYEDSPYGSLLNVVDMDSPRGNYSNV